MPNTEGTELPERILAVNDGWWREAANRAKRDDEIEYVRADLASVSPEPKEQTDWVTFGRIKVDIENETETFERIPVNEDKATSPSAAAISKDSELKADPWLPIETAPKDGTRVLFYTPEDKEMGWLAFVAESYFDKRGELNDVHVHQWQDGLEPTHWRPLPLPPTQAEEQTMQKVAITKDKELKADVCILCGHSKKTFNLNCSPEYLYRDRCGACGPHGGITDIILCGCPCVFPPTQATETVPAKEDKNDRLR